MADFIADNFFIIVIILGVLFSFLKNKSGTDDNENKQSESSNRPRSSTNRKSSDSRSVNDDLIPGYSSGSSGSSASGKASIEQQQGQQMKELEKRMRTRAASASVDKMNTRSKTVAEGQSENTYKSNFHDSSGNSGNPKPHQHEFKKEIKGKLNRKELIDSIIMAEVLGPPRSKKPYSSIVNRKK